MDSVFPRAEREIFGYYNGVKDVKGDPLEIEARYLREMMGENLDSLTKALNTEDPAVFLPAQERLLPAVRAAFRVEPYDEDTGEGGLTRNELFDLFAAFTEWKSQKKGLTGSGPNTSPSTDAIPESPSPTNVSSENT